MMLRASLLAQVIKDDMWPNPLQYFLVPDVDIVSFVFFSLTNNCSPNTLLTQGENGEEEDEDDLDDDEDDDDGDEEAGDDDGTHIEHSKLISNSFHSEGDEGAGDE